MDKYGSCSMVDFAGNFIRRIITYSGKTDRGQQQQQQTSALQYVTIVIIRLALDIKYIREDRLGNS